MKKYFKLSLSKRLFAISASIIIPMILLLAFLLASLSSATNAYSDIIRNVSVANQYVKDFQERIDYTMYLAVIKNESISELDVGTTTINGIVTVNPYIYINELEDVCDNLSDTSTVSTNANQIIRLKNSLKALRNCVRDLEKQIIGNGAYDEKMNALNNNIYMLTDLIKSGLQDYIYNEISHIDIVKENLDKQNRQTLTVCVVVSVFAILLSVILTMTATKSVSKPIRKLCDLTSKVAGGDFTVKTNVESADEIAVLTRNFNNMTQEIGVLVEDIKKNQENLHIIETKLLQAQINPHFLYNTLDTIVWLAEEKKNDQVVAIVTYLSDFFRTTLSKGRDFITIQDEELHIISYLRIQKFRYQDILDYVIDIDKALYEFYIPKLLLQPLVENALSHGVRNKRGQGHISITGRKEGDNIVFKVIDDGRGMDVEELKRLRNSLANDDYNMSRSGGFGVVNVNQRIHAYYGEECGVSFESELDKGTEATIVITAKNIQPFS